MTAKTVEKVREIVRSAMVKRTPGIKIVSINVREDVDEDDDRILKITVVFEPGTGERFDAARRVGLARNVIPELLELREAGFPVFSFVSKADLGKTKPEAA